MKIDMKEQKLRDLFHDYRPAIADNDEFMQKLTEQMDAADAREQQQSRIISFYHRVLPWVAGIAAALVVALLIIKEPAATPVTSYSQPRLPEYYHNAPSYSEFSSYEDIVNEIERSGRQLENAIAQL